MFKSLTISTHNSTAQVYTLLATVAMYFAQMSANGCYIYTFEQPRVPKSLIK